MRPVLLLPSIFPSIRIFSNESALYIRRPKYWSFSFSISPSNEYSGFLSDGFTITQRPTPAVKLSVGEEELGKHLETVIASWQSTFVCVWNLRQSIIVSFKNQPYRVILLCKRKWTHYQGTVWFWRICIPFPTVKIIENFHHSPKHPSCCFAASFLPCSQPWATTDRLCHFTLVLAWNFV